MTRLFGFLVLGRLERLEHLYSVGREEWIDIVLWGASKGGPFGHCHMCILKNGGKTEWTARTEEEELKLMRQQYEECGHRLYGRGEPVAFSVYLETSAIWVLLNLLIGVGRLLSVLGVRKNPG